MGLNLHHLIFIWGYLIYGIPVACLRLTNMTASLIHDARTPMHLHCAFDMGDERLYAVKWYKDDHEFFRYTPNATLLYFPVDGVRVDIKRTQCRRDACDLYLIDLTVAHTSGAYRCEVSSEAPSFRLASATRNVTVTAMPTAPPTMQARIIDTILTANCTSMDHNQSIPHFIWMIDNRSVDRNHITHTINGRHFVSHLRIPLIDLHTPTLDIIVISCAIGTPDQHLSTYKNITLDGVAISNEKLWSNSMCTSTNLILLTIIVCDSVLVLN